MSRLQPVVTSVVSGVAKVIPSFVKTWYLNKLTEKLAKSGVCRLPLLRKRHERCLLRRRHVPLVPRDAPLRCLPQACNTTTSSLKMRWYRPQCPACRRTSSLSVSVA